MSPSNLSRPPPPAPPPHPPSSSSSSCSSSFPPPSAPPPPSSLLHLLTRFDPEGLLDRLLGIRALPLEGRLVPVVLVPVVLRLVLLVPVVLRSVLLVPVVLRPVVAGSRRAAGCRRSWSRWSAAAAAAGAACRHQADVLLRLQPI
eukprot:1030163-Pyramimonas_sp.AAC.1